MLGKKSEERLINSITLTFLGHVREMKSERPPSYIKIIPPNLSFQIIIHSKLPENCLYGQIFSDVFRCVYWMYSKCLKAEFPFASARKIKNFSDQDNKPLRKSNNIFFAKNVYES